MLHALAVEGCINSIRKGELPINIAIPCFESMSLTKDEVLCLHHCVLLLWKTLTHEARATIINYYLHFVAPDDDYSLNSSIVSSFFCLEYSSFLPFIPRLAKADPCMF